MKLTKNTPEEVTETILAAYIFTDEEKQLLGEDLARENANWNELEDQRKQANSDFKARQDASNALINSLTQKINSGQELRPTECVVTFDPKARTKTFTNARTNEFVKRAEMTAADFQLTLDERKSE